MRIKGQEQVAALFGVAPKTITEWQVVGFPVAVQGGPGVPSEYDAAACVAWLVEREVRKVRAESPKDRLARLQGDKLEREAAVESKQLIPASEIEPMWEGAVIAAREFIVGEPPRLASLAMGREKTEIEDLLRGAFDEFLRRLANWRAVMDDDATSDAADGEDGEDDA